MLELPTLRTDRLVLAPLRLKHSAGMFELWSSESVCRHSGEAHNFQGDLISLPAIHRSDSDQIIEFFQRHEELGSAFRWAISLEPDQTFIGTFGANKLGDAIEIAYHQIPKYWGHRFMWEAASAGIEWLQTAYEPTVFEAFVEPDNHASIKLLNRLGFHEDEKLRAGAVRYQSTRAESM